MSSSLSLVPIGTVSKLHGFKGSLVVYTSAGKESSLATLQRVWLGTTPQNAQCFHLLSSTWMPKGWKVVLESVSTEDEARGLIGKQVFAERTDLPTLKKGEYYLSDLLGLPGVDGESNQVVGIMERIEESRPIQSVKTTFWVFKPKNAEANEIFVPAVAYYIEAVQLDEKVIRLKNLNDLLISEEE